MDFEKRKNLIMNPEEQWILRVFFGISKPGAADEPKSSLGRAFSDDWYHGVLPRSPGSPGSGNGPDNGTQKGRSELKKEASDGIINTVKEAVYKGV